MSGPRYRLCIISPDGSLNLSPLTISPEAAANRDPQAFLEFFEECKRVALKLQPKPKQLSFEQEKER